MRLFLGFFLAGVISTSYAIFPRQAGYPACTDACLANITSSQCLSGEVSCLCKDQTFVSAQTACFKQACSASDFNTAASTADAACAAAGVTLSSSPTATSPASAASATSNSKSQSSASSASTPSSKPNSAGSTMVNIIGGAAALGLAALAL